MSDKLWIVRLPDRYAVTTIQEAVARKAYADNPGSTLSHRPFPSTVKTPFIDKDGYAFGERDGVDSCTHLPTGITGWSDDRRDAYKQMLRALHESMERELETVVSE